MPPNPKEFDNTQSTLWSIEFKGIKFKPFASGKGDTKFKVGGNFLFLIESTEYIDSTLPEAPNK